AGGPRQGVARLADGARYRCAAHRRGRGVFPGAADLHATGSAGPVVTLLRRASGRQADGLSQPSSLRFDARQGRENRSRHSLFLMLWPPPAAEPFGGRCPHILSGEIVMNRLLLLAAAVVAGLSGCASPAHDVSWNPQTGVGVVSIPDNTDMFPTY